MPLKLIGRASEKSNIGIKFTFEHPDDSDVKIRQMSWTLTNIEGAVINSRSDVTHGDQSSVGYTLADTTIVLSGNDLQLLDQTKEYELRVLTLQAEYYTEAGDWVPLIESAEFPVYNMTAVM